MKGVDDSELVLPCGRRVLVKIREVDADTKGHWLGRVSNSIAPATLQVVKRCDSRVIASLVLSRGFYTLEFVNRWRLPLIEHLPSRP